MVFALIQPVLANVGEVIIPLVMVIFFVLKQILEANKAVGPQRPRPAVPPPQPQQVPKGMAPPAAGQQADPLRAQVEEFLRRAGQQPQARPPQRPAPPARASDIEVLIDPSRQADPRTIGQPLRQAEWRKSPMTTSETASPAAIPQPSPGAKIGRPARSPAKSRKRQSVADHVTEQVSAHTRSLADKASQLGQRIVAEDQQFDVQLKSKFDHTVGTLVGTTLPAAAESAPPTAESPAAQLAAMLANPGGIRQAVLVNEILRRPSDRW